MAERGTMTATFEPTLDVRRMLKGKPTEYVVVNPVTVEAEFGDGRVERFPQEIREFIVRCRDCKYAMEHRSKSILGTELVTLTCSGPIQGAYSEGTDVEPEGFCAWGEPREGE